MWQPGWLIFVYDRYTIGICNRYTIAKQQTHSSNVVSLFRKHSCLFQSPVEYASLELTREHWDQAENYVAGMCYYSGRLYTTGKPRDTTLAENGMNRLTVYSVMDQDTITLLNTLDLGEHAGEPRVDHQSGRVYIPCGINGICVAKFDGSKLVRVTTLHCVRKAIVLAVASPNTLYVIDWDSQNVCLVDVTQDRVTARLQVPHAVKDVWGIQIAVLGDTVLVVYGVNLVLYRHGVPTPGRLLALPQGVHGVFGLTTDNHSAFLVSDRTSRTMCVLDISCNLTHTIPLPWQRRPLDCTVVGRQLWVLCENGHILVLSSK